MKNVLLIKGLSQYDAMRHYIDEIEIGFRLSGYNTIIIDSSEESFIFQLKELDESIDIHYIFSCNAIHVEIFKDLPNAFSNALQITYLCDHPAAHRVRLQQMKKGSIIFTCDALYATYIKEYCPNIKNVMFIPLSGSYSKKYIPYQERKHNLVFTGTYTRPEEIYLEITSSLKGTLKTFAEYMLNDIISNPEQTLDMCLQNALQKTEVEMSKEEFHELACIFHPIDVYARTYYRDKILHILVENGIPVHVFGNGWENFESEYSENLIIEKGNSYVAQKAVANAKLSLNIMPWFKSGFQERIATAMLSGTIAITDESAYINEQFEDGKELLTFSLKRLEELPTKIKTILANPDLAQHIAANGKKRAENELTWQHRTFEMVDYIRQCTKDQEPIFPMEQTGEILRIPYQHYNNRIFGKDIIVSINNILDMFHQVQLYDNIEVCDIKYLYTSLLYLYIKAKANFPELSISSRIHEYIMNLTEDTLPEGMELFLYECAHLQSMFLRTEYFLLSVENQKYAENEKIQSSQSNHFKEHEQKVLAQRILQKYSGTQNNELAEILEVIRAREFVTAYNQKFTMKYVNTFEECLASVHFDEVAGMYYALFNGHKMYYPKSHSREDIASEINFVHLEQDVESPHRYLDDNFYVPEGAIVIDAGVAEGNFSLEIIEKCQKLYIVEYDHEWITALKKTFEPWKEKVVIIEKMLGAVDDDTHIRIDSFVEESEVHFIKMDVEGAEIDSLNGASRILSNSTNIRCAICAYHRKNAERDIKTFLEERGFSTTNTKGYMFFKEDMDSWIDAELRRGIVRGEKHIH